MKMKDLFPGYYPISDDELQQLWKDCLFIFDTSFLLDLYKMTSKTCNDVLNILEDIKDRLWMPYQVVYEFHKNKHRVYNDQIKIYDTLIKDLEKKKDEIKRVIKEYNKHRLINADKLISDFEKIFLKVKSELRAKQSKHKAEALEDIIIIKLNELFENKIGDVLNENDRKKIEKEAKERFENKTPPGFADAEKKGPNAYGDYFIWHEIIDIAKKNLRVSFLLAMIKRRIGTFMMPQNPFGHISSCIMNFF
jgi:hypothetical protein